MSCNNHLCAKCGAPLPEDATRDTALCSACLKQVKQGSVLRPRTCKQCGDSFMGGPRASYCPDCRLERRRAADRHHKSAGSCRKLGQPYPCQRCGQLYTLTGSLQRYCPDCAEIAVKEAVSARKRQRTVPRQPRVRPSLTCQICGQPIPEDRRTKATCSDACDARRRRLRQYEADIKRRRTRNPPE